MIADTDSHASAASGPDEDVTTTLYRAAIGPVSNAYYLPIFTRFDAVDRAGISWNTAASLSTFNWLLFRQLWGAALIYVAGGVALVLLIVGIVQMLFQWSDTLIAALALGFGLAAFVLPGLFGNAVFYADCRKRMARALVGHNTVTEACSELTREAATRRRAIVLLAVNVAAALVAAVIYLQISGFSTLAQAPHSAAEVGQVAVTGPIETTPTLPLAAPDLAPSSAVAASAAAAPSSAAASAPVRATTTLATTSVTATADKPQRAASVVSKDAPDKPYFINVGLFAVPTNAAKAHAKLLEARLPSVTHELNSSKGSLTRVRVGPFASREKAQDAVVKIQVLKLEAVIVQP